MAALSNSLHTSRALILAPPILIGLMAGAVMLKSWLAVSPSAEIALASAPATVVVAPASFSYRAPGEYTRDGYAVDAPMLTVDVTRPLTIMKYQVSKGDYARCVADGACAAPEPEFPMPGEDNVPATGISFEDAKVYAAWLSRTTGESWRLPTDEELAFAAGTRFPDDGLGVNTDSASRADRWLEAYRRETARGVGRDPMPKALGYFGENEHGLADFAGNVWEWSTTRYRRIALDRTTADLDDGACGIQLVAGQHRAAMVFFVRNPKGGGCAVGTPPDNLGFRLVKDTRWFTPLLTALRTRGFIL